MSLSDPASLPYGEHCLNHNDKDRRRGRCKLFLFPNLNIQERSKEPLPSKPVFANSIPTTTITTMYWTTVVSLSGNSQVCYPIHLKGSAWESLARENSSHLLGSHRPLVHPLQNTVDACEARPIRRQLAPTKAHQVVQLQRAVIWA